MNECMYKVFYSYLETVVSVRNPHSDMVWGVDDLHRNTEATDMGSILRLQTSV